MQFNSLNITSFRLDIEHVHPECGKSKLLKAVFSLGLSSADKGHFLTGIFLKQPHLATHALWI